jgi:O-antigen ligase
VQLAQWAIFAFSAGAFWLTANLIKDQTWLRRLTAAFLLLAGSVAIARMVPGLANQIDRLVTVAFIRAPLWILLAGLAGGQLLFNRQLSIRWRLFLLLTLAAVVVYAFVQQQEATSNWIGVGAVVGALVWFRFPRLRVPILAGMILLTVLGILFPTIYQFAGGDQEWTGSGAPRLVLARRVIDVTMRNPITGLGPAAYRRYAAMEPLRYLRAFWVLPQVNSHNNYVDIFSQTGLVGLALFGWFIAEVGLLGIRLRRRFAAGFAAGYVNGMLAVGIGALVVMVFADWILPFVYNIGFEGFQASVLVWLFLGGLVALENMPDPDSNPLQQPSP